MGAALSFNGSSSYVLVKSGFLLGGQANSSVSMWIQNSQAVPGGGIALYAERASSGNDIYKVEIRNGSNSLGFTFRDTAGTLSQPHGTVVINDGKKHHLVITKAGKTIKGYVDNVLDFTSTVTTSDTLTNTGIESRLGSDKGDSSAWFAGIIDEVQLYSRALTPEEVTSLYNGQYIEPTNLQAYYREDDGAGLTAADDSGNRLDAVLSGTVKPVWGTGLVDPIITVRSQPIVKRYYYKIYSPNQVYITTWVNDVISDPTFRQVINGGAGELIIKLARPYDNFGEGSDVALQNRVELWVADQDNTTNNTAAVASWDSAVWDTDLWDGSIRSFIKLYAGLLQDYAPVLDGDSQYIEVTVLGFVTEASYRILKDSSGNTQVAYNSYDPGTIMMNVIDKYRADGGINISYGSNTINLTGTVVSYTFNHNTLKECFDKIVELCPNNWYWYIDANGVVYLKQGTTTQANHVVTIGKDIGYLKTIKRSENMSNQVFVVGGGSPNLFLQYGRSASISAYGKFERKIQDGRVTDASTADVMAKRELDRNDTPETRSIIRIIDNNGEDSGQGANIESFNIGDTIQIKNLKYGSAGRTYWDIGKWDIDVWDATLAYSTADISIIQAITYYPDYIEVEASSRLPEVAKRIEDINRNLDVQIQDSLPASPTIRSV